MNQKRRIYLDHGASTPVDPRVIEAMAPYWATVYANPSATHQDGRLAAQALDDARQTIARLFNVQPDEVIFTGGGSASDNLALRGVLWAARQAGRGSHLITSAIEHPAVLQTAVQLRDLFGFAVTVLPVDGNGRVQPADVEAAIRPDTALISIMAANNEIGTLQPVAEIGAIARAHGVLLHTDAIQAAGHALWDLQTMPVDLLSLAAHKFYGPKGIGVLIARAGIELVPVITGGSQEEGRRAGTSNVPLAVGTAAALRLVAEEGARRGAALQALRDQLIAGVLAAFPEGCRLTGHPTARLPHHASFAFRDLNANDLLMHLDMAGIAASSGSACKSGSPKPSAILQALGLGPAWTIGGLRLTVGTQNTADDVAAVLDVLARAVPRLRQLGAPLVQG
ncbi:MAG: cysteine desulfurase [Anaerolineales bacterium]|nr:cysteine desulfurase [Anaerolineales bacterium]